MKKYFFSFMLLFWWVPLICQVYYISDDSLSFIIKVINAKDTVKSIRVHIINESNTNIFLCKRKDRTVPVYINAIDGPLIFGCGCEYGFNQDYNDKGDNYEVIRIGKKDTMSLDISVAQFLGKRLLKKEFIKRSKHFKIDYVLSNSILLFNKNDYIYEEFNKHKKRLVFFLSGE